MAAKTKRMPPVVSTAPVAVTDLFLPTSYVERVQPEIYDDFGSDGRCQQAVYDLAVRRAKELGCERIVDFGCGAAQKIQPLGSRFEVVGVDLANVVERLRGREVQTRERNIDKPRYRGFKAMECDFETETFVMPNDRPTLIIAADVIEHLKDPSRLLASIRYSLQAGCRRAFISSPCRVHNAGCSKEGPPHNPAHVREWSCTEFAYLLKFAGLDVLSLTHVAERPESQSEGTMVAEVLDGP